MSANPAIDTKDEQTMIEMKDQPGVDGPGTHDESALLVSAYESASRGAVIRKFWRLFAIGIAVASAGM
jgi:hypothetical protein